MKVQNGQQYNRLTIVKANSSRKTVGYIACANALAEQSKKY